MLGRIPRRAVAATLAAAAVLIPASPALANFCYKDFNSGTAAAKAAKSGPWSTKADMIAFVEQSGEVPPCAQPAALAWLNSQPATTLYMGPGLLAGGTEGTDRTPKNISYIPIGSFFAACLEEPPAV